MGRVLPTRHLWPQMGTESSKRWKRRGVMVKATDPIMRDPQPTDIVIPIMGPTGSGKSTLVNRLAGRPVVRVGNDLESCTVNLEPVIIEAGTWKNPTVEQTARRLILVDTPGFDDTYVEDSEILRRISVWLAASYTDSMKIAGVIFLHEISQVRMRGTARRNTDVFKELCGKDIMEYTVLATTMWDEVPLEVGGAREDQLRKVYWERMIKEGAQVKRIGRDSDTAWEIVHSILAKHEKGFNDTSIMSIQRELVDLQMLLPDTEAGRSLRESLKKELEQQKERMKQLMESAGAEREMARRKQYDDMKKTLRQISKLNVSVPRRILEFFGV